MLQELRLKPEGLTFYDKVINLSSSVTSTSSPQLKLYVPVRPSSVDWDLGHSTPFRLMMMSEAVLAKEWDTPEEDELWAHL